MSFHHSSYNRKTAVVIGGGPAGLMAAEMLAAGNVQVALFDAMPSVGRKFLLAGKGGMNLTHAEADHIFLSRYGNRRMQMEPLLATFGAASLREWVHGLGIDTFVGSSQRVFPTDMKAAPLLRAWLQRLRSAGVQFHMRHQWLGWKTHSPRQELRFSTPQGETFVQADVVVLALGGGSWRRLGSDGAWIPVLRQQKVEIADLRPANCGFDACWSNHLLERFAGHPVKSVTATCSDASGQTIQKQGEFIISQTGVEGSLVYALSSVLRDRITADGHAVLYLDLAPGKSLQRVIDEIALPRGARSMASHLQSKAGISGVKAALLRELADKEAYHDPVRLANMVKALPLKLLAARPLDEAISSAGGVLFESLNEHLMLNELPGVFCAGEMLDWEAPTGGYLLTACFASGRHAGASALKWIESRP
jgi:uncharacterized flavoprotein (TIGR03862 family)